MATAWDQRSATEQRHLQNVLLKQTVLQMALAHVPYVRAKLAAAGIDARLFGGLDQLRRLPTTMRRDIVDPQRNPEGSSAVVLHGTAEGVKRFSDRSVLRRIAMARLLGGEEEQQLAIESATRAIHVHLVPGPGGKIPVAFTRDDLDLSARAGARLASLVGLAREDTLLNLVPFGASLDFWGIYYMAHGLGMSAVHNRRDGQDLARAVAGMADVGPTAVAVPADEATEFVATARAAGADLARLRVFIPVGRSLSIEERAAVGEGLLAAGARDAAIAAAYGVAEGRVLWGECAVPAGRTETFGFHTFPDLEVLEIVSPETGEALAEETPGEITLTPLGFRGGGVPRWRSGDLALGGMTVKPCPNCGRSVPRIGPTVLRGAWQHLATLDGRRAWIDLRDAGAAAAERAHEWQVDLRRENGGHALFVHIATPDERTGSVIDLYEDLARLGSPPTQIVLGSEAEIAERCANTPGPWPRYRESTEHAFASQLAAD